MMRATSPVRGGVKVRAYPILCPAVEEGVVTRLPPGLPSGRGYAWYNV